MRKIYVHGCEVLLYGERGVRINADTQEKSDKIWAYLIAEGIVTHDDY